MSPTSAYDAGSNPLNQLNQYLLSNEFLLWSGRPDPSVRFTKADTFMIPFSIMWGGFAIFWEAGVLRSNAPFFFRLWGVPFVAVGLYFIFGRFAVKRRQKIRTVYGVTAQRALIAVGNLSVSDMPIASTPTTITKSADGSHVNVIFGVANRSRGFGMYGNTGMEFMMRGAAPVFAFYDVANPQALIAALDQARGTH